MEIARGNPLSEHAAPETFEDIYSAYSDRVLNLAYRLTGDEEIARDLSQEIFVKVYENLARFEQRFPQTHSVGGR